MIVWQDAQIQHLLTPALADSLKLTPTGHFAVVGNATPIVLTKTGGLFDLAAGHPVPSVESLNLNTFTGSAGLLVGIRGDRLGWVADGRFHERVRLPAAGLQVAAGPRQRLFVYGAQGSGGAVYALEANRVRLLVQLDDGAISALAAIGERLFFAVGNAVYTVATGERPAVVFVAHGEERIRSLAPDPLTGLLYFSAGHAVYAMRAGVAVAVLRGLAGYLQYRQKALYVLDPAEKRLVKLIGLEKLTSATAPDTPGPAPSATLKE